MAEAACKLDPPALEPVEIARRLAAADRLQRSGDSEGAAALIREALDTAPDDPDLLYRLALLEIHAERPRNAAALLGRALAARPEFPEAQFDLGFLLQRAGRLEEAATLYERAVARRPSYAAALNNLGNVRRAQRRVEEAVAAYERALAVAPTLPEAHNNLGNARRMQGDFAGALECYRAAVRLRPSYVEALANIGNIHQLNNEIDDAIQFYSRAVALKPDYAVALNNLGVMFGRRSLWQEAENCYGRALAADPNYPEALSNMGVVLGNRQDWEGSAAYQRRALARKSDYPEAHNNLGNALQAMGRDDEAEIEYRKVVALQPDNAGAWKNLAMTQLAAGKFEEGWRNYEWRWYSKQLAHVRRDFDAPRWEGEPAAGKIILLHAEQGFGDTLQFCRYVPLVAARGLRPILEVPPALYRLIRSIAGDATVLTKGQSLPQFDLHCPLLSLPLALGTRVETIPAAVPYLAADPDAIARWSERLGPADGTLRVGIAWAGAQRRGTPELWSTDARRSLDPALLGPLAGLPGVRFYSLQKTGPKVPAGFGFVDLMKDTADFADTAALVENLDLVISADTAVAHLAGALGKEVWLMNRFDSCWRWFRERRDSPWYPTLRQFRQPSPGDWDSVIGEIAAALRRRGDQA